MLHPTTIAKVTEDLAALGSTPEEVHANLVRLGIRGHPCSNRSCPIAVYLHGLGHADWQVGRSAVFFREHADTSIRPAWLAAVVGYIDGQHWRDVLDFGN